MSAETHAALEAALSAHIADESEGRFLTDWYCISASIGDEDGQTNYLHVSSDSPTHALMGLARFAVRRLDAYHDTGTDVDED